MLHADFLAVSNKRVFVEALNAFELTQLIKALRFARYATTEAKAATLEPVALTGLRRFPANRFILATGLAALLDCGQITTVLRTLAESGIRLDALDVRVGQGAAHAG